MKTPFLLTVVLFFGAVASCPAGDAKALWTNQCQKCHGADGKGQTAMGKKLHLKDLTAADVQAAMKDDEMAGVIKDGRKSKEGNTLMKPVEGATDDDIKALVQLVRGMKS